MNTAQKQWALVISGVLGFVVPAYFGWTLYVQHTPQNAATWGMVFVLDLLGLILAFKDGNKKPFMQLGWALAAFCILLAVILNHNQITWGWTEISSVFLGVVAIALWLMWSAEKALWAYMVAMYLSFVPQAVDYWKEPQPDTLWLWLMSIATCLFAVLGAEKYNFANLFVPVAAAILNVAITILCIL